MIAGNESRMPASEVHFDPDRAFQAIGCGEMMIIPPQDVPIRITVSGRACLVELVTQDVPVSVLNKRIREELEVEEVKAAGRRAWELAHECAAPGNGDNQPLIDEHMNGLADGPDREAGLGD